MIEKIIFIVKNIDSCDMENVELGLKQLEVCHNMIEHFMKTEKPKDKKIYEGLQCYYLKKLFGLNSKSVVID
jgi:hypothetical protein